MQMQLRVQNSNKLMLSSGITIRVSGVSSATKKIKHSGEIQFAVSDGLSQQLWLAGESFSLADIGLTPYITRVDRRVSTACGRAAERRAMVCRNSGTSKLRYSDNGVCIYRLR